METKELKIGDIVKVVKNYCGAVPIDPKYMGKFGNITAIHNREAPISVAFGSLGKDSFWPEELEKQN